MLLSIPSSLRVALILAGVVIVVIWSPKLLSALLEIVARAFQLLGTLLVAPVGAVSLQRRRCGHQPWAWVAWYGEVIEALVYSVQAVTGRLQRMLAGRGRPADGGH